MCGSAAGSIASSTASSRSCSSRSDSGAESDSSRGSVSSHDSTECPATPALSVPGAPRQFRSALRSSTGSPATARKAKSVSFKSDADGVVFCTPPTAAALSLLAAGAPAVSGRPAKDALPAQVTASASRPSFATAPVASPSPTRPAARTAPDCAASSSDTAAAAAVVPQPASTPAPPGRPSPARGQRTVATPSTPAPAPAPRPDPFTSPSAGRQRVLAALAEARARHAHLGTTTTPDNWPLPLEAGEPWQHNDAEAARAQEAEAGARRIADVSERLVNAPAVVVTERDAEIVKVSYATRPAAAAAPDESTPAPTPTLGLASVSSAPGKVSTSGACIGVAGGRGQAGQEEWRGRQAPSGRRASWSKAGSSGGGSRGAGGSDSCAALLREVVAERMRRAEAMLSQAYSRQ